MEELDRPTQNELRALDEIQRPYVAGHLVMAGRLLEEDPETALKHAQAASARASRLAVVREAAGLAAYACGQWEQASRDLKAAMRISGSVEFLPVVADCERGLGRPERALTIAGSSEAEKLSAAGKVEMRIVTAGARVDMGQLDAALVTLKCPQLQQTSVQEWSVNLWYAYADVLQRLDRTNEAVQWFAKAADADIDEETDAAERLAALLED
jgi:tetratricopeptide (TPR) repeat protein